MPRQVRRSLGEMLLDQGLISKVQLLDAQEEERRSGEPLRKVVLRLGFIAEEDLVDFIAVQMEIPRIELTNYMIDINVLGLVPEDLARKHQMIPVLKIGDTLTCAMVDVFNIYAIDELALRTNMTIELAITTEAELRKALNDQYSLKGSLFELAGGLTQVQSPAPAVVSDGGLPPAASAEEAPVVRMVNGIVAQAVQEGASDIHIEPEETSLIVRFRVDGVLNVKEPPPKHLQSPIISRIKIMASMNISERRRPQEGRFQMKMNGRQIDVRVSSLPTVYGENIVMRLLDTSNVLMGLDEIGMQGQTLERFKELLLRPNGIILVTGPTGSGKTTTLYAGLNLVNSPQKGIVTIEDPVEYRLRGVRQIQVDPNVDLTFANGLRSILRQDPDIIMIGEIRDLDTAEIAIQAALTGHLVFSTLHTNNAAGAMARLIDLGVEPFLLSSSIVGVLAQRLVAKICQECRGRGCKVCRNTGYKGRTGIYELLLPNPEVKRLTMERAPLEAITQAAVMGGMMTLYDDGMSKVAQGITTKEEVLRVSREG